MILFARRAWRDQTLTADRKIWVSRCGRYRVVFSRCRYGPRTGRQAIADRYYAQVIDPNTGHWGIISQHRVEARAFDACRADAAKSDGGRD